MRFAMWESDCFRDETQGPNTTHWKARLRRKAKDAKRGETHDCALDLAPLALPPDFPPVILINLGVVVGFEVL
jgi:hypothetical protein